MRRLTLPLFSLLLLASTAVQAHHSFAVHFVSDNMVTVSGVVTDFSFSNPHGLIYWTSVDADGNEQEWKAETNSPNMLRRRGWAPNSIRPGDEVTITGFPARDGSNYMRVSIVEFADGRDDLIGQRQANYD